MPVEHTRSATIVEVVTRPLVTVHLPPERAVLTTPGMVGLMERCIARAEEEAGWQSRSVEVRHRAGLKEGERLHVIAEITDATDGATVWSVKAEADGGRVIGEGTIVRQRIG